MKLILLAIIAILTLLLSMMSWRNSLKSIFFLLVIEGIFRKWVFPGASETIYFFKDIVLIGAYIDYLFLSQEKRYPIKSSLITTLFGLSLCWGIIQAFNPNMGSWLIGVLGLKAYFLYIPTIWLIPDLFRSANELYKFLRSHLLLSIPVGLLGIVQFFSPRNSFVNRYAGISTTNVANFGGEDVARISGTFSYLGSYSVYLTVCFALLFCLFNIEKTRKWKIIFASQIALVTVNCFMSGSRTAVYSAVIFVAGFIFFELFKNFKLTLSLSTKIIMPAAIIVLMLKFGLGSSYELFSARAEGASEEFNSRTTLFIAEPIRNFKYASFYGYGTGATHQARGAVAKFLDLEDENNIPVQYEQEPGRIMLDVGLIGFLFWYGLRIFILFKLFVLYNSLNNNFLRQLTLSAFIIHLLAIRSHVVYNHTFAVYYWFLASFIFLMPLLDFRNKIGQARQEREEIVQAI